MLEFFRDHPGRYFLLATLLPLAASVLLFLVALVRSMLRKPGAEPGRIPDWGALVVLFAMASAAVFSVGGSIRFFRDQDKVREFVAQAPVHDAKLTEQLREKFDIHDSNWNERFVWIRFGPTKQSVPITLGYHIDALTALMMSMVTIIGTLIVLFSIGYLHDERKKQVHDHAIHIHRRGRYGRFFAYLGLFAFSMLNLLIADNLLQVFISWELVGLCSFFLIGFYTERPSAMTAANKAFIVNRIGDAGFLMALLIAWTQFGTFDINSLNHSPTTLLFGLALFLGAVGKSAQVPLQTWLPDAMEGPTPVSALIHAATMVAAGVYLVGRCFMMFNAQVHDIITIVGAITAVVSATTAVVQTDIKRVLAFSTCSQLGLMMLAIGLGFSAVNAALLHLLTHAFFKALLFLCAGSVINACHHEQDLRKMGGLRKKMPITAWTMLIGVLAISGMPFFSGWYSKDLIVNAIFGEVNGYGLTLRTNVILVSAILTLPLTAFYMMRLWLLAFAGTPRNEKIYNHAHESPAAMTIPLIILAAFSIGMAWGWPLWIPESSVLGQLLGNVIPFTHLVSMTHEHKFIDFLPGIIALGLSILGFGLAIGLYRKGSFFREDNTKPIRRFLFERWYFDNIYNLLFVRTTREAAFAAAHLDKSAIDVGTTTARYDGKSLDGWLAASASLVASMGSGLKSANRGRPRAYVLVLGLTAVVTLGILSRFLK